MDKVVYEVKFTLDNNVSSQGNASLSSQVQNSNQEKVVDVNNSKVKNEDIKDKNNTAVSNAIIGGYTLLQEARQVYTFVRDMMVTNKVASLYISGDNLSIKNTQRQIAIQDAFTNHVESALTPILYSSVGTTFAGNFGLGPVGAVFGFALGLFGMVRGAVSSLNTHSANIKMYNAQRYQDNYIKSLNAERLVKNSKYYR